MLPRVVVAALAVSVGACASVQQPQKPAGEPPTPTSISKEEPGGDAEDPRRAALERLLTEPFRTRPDKFNSILVPLADHPNWRRVKIWGYPTRATFRYGDDHHALSVVWYTDAEGDDSVPACYDKFMGFAGEIAEQYKAEYELDPLERRDFEVRGEPSELFLRGVEGHVSAGFVSDDYYGAFAVHPSWPGTCLVYAFAVVSTDHPELARQVRDRWLEEAAHKLRWKSKVEPLLEDR